MFATSRDLVAHEALADRFGKERGPLRYGRCTMEFAPLPGMDSLAERLPFYVPEESKKLAAVEEVPDEDFWPLLASREGATDPNEPVLLMTHGYNFDFERACKRATELQRTLEDGFSVVLFTWPSAGNPMSYTRDETNAGWSVPHLREFLDRALAELEGRELHLLAHSLGTRTMSRALESMAQADHDAPPFAELVLSAADVDTAIFETRWPKIRGLVRRLTLYVSDNDAPLKASRRLHGYPRLGEAGEFLTILDGAETIDASSTGYFELTGHNYQYFHPLLLADLQELLETGRGASRREFLEARRLNGDTYWVLQPPPKLDEPPPSMEKVI